MRPIFSTFTKTQFLIAEPPEMLKPIMETAGNAGGEMKLFCSATGYPDIKFYWYKVCYSLTYL